MFWLVGSAMQVAFLLATRVSSRRAENGAVMIFCEMPLLPIEATS